MRVLVRPEGDPEPAALVVRSDAHLEELAWAELRRLVALEGSELVAGFQPAWSLTNLIGSGFRILDVLEV